MKPPLSKAEVQRRQRTQSGVLKEEEVARIKWLLLQGYTAREVKDAYNVSLATIRAINRGDTWDWVRPCSPDEVYVSTDGTEHLPRVDISEERRVASEARLAELLGEAAGKKRIEGELEEFKEGGLPGVVVDERKHFKGEGDE